MLLCHLFVFFEEMMFGTCPHFHIGKLVFSLLNFKEFFVYLGPKSPYQYVTYQCFSLCQWSAFSEDRHSQECLQQRLFILIKSKLTVSSIMDHGSVLKTHSQTQGQTDLSPTLSLGSFMSFVFYIYLSNPSRVRFSCAI